MKRLFAAILVLMMALSLCACGDTSSAKFVGAWADETYTYTLSLDEEGGAVLKIGDTIYPSTVISWEAQGFDTVVIKLDLAKYDFVFGDEDVKPEIPGYVEPAPEAVPADLEATEPEATEPEATEPEEDEKEDKPAAKRKGEVVIARLTLGIQDGDIYLNLAIGGEKKPIATLIKLS